MKIYPLVLTGLTALLAIFQWFQIVYRWRLFTDCCHGQRWINHVADGSFAQAYFVNAISLLATIVAVRLLWHGNRLALVPAALAGLANLAACATLLFMRGSGILVEYMEFIRHAQG